MAKYESNQDILFILNIADNKWVNTCYGAAEIQIQTDILEIQKCLNEHRLN